MQAGRTFRRRLSLCAAALVFLQLAGMVHLAAAPHGVCWEHGVVVELDLRPGAGDPVAAPEGLAQARVLLVRSDQHPHCPALWVLRQARLEKPSTAAVLACAQSRPPLALPEPLAAPTGWALRRAPKQSPPV